MGNCSMAHFLETSRLLIENARGVPDISLALSGFGYDEARLAAGAKLLAETEALVRKQEKEYGEQHEASDEVEKARLDLDSAYIKSLKVARVAFAEDAKVSAALRLYGPRKQSQDGWLDQASSFYANLESDPGLLGKMAKFGYSAQKLKAEAGLLEALHKKIQLQAKETGEAQTATMERDRKVKELDGYVSDLRAIAKVAFYESPQELEKLGIMARSAPRRKKAEAARPGTASK
jgi:hypothetical protein